LEELENMVVTLENKIATLEKINREKVSNVEKRKKRRWVNNWESAQKMELNGTPITLDYKGDTSQFGNNLYIIPGTTFIVDSENHLMLPTRKLLDARQ
jgi:hypothetical protein